MNNYLKLLLPLDLNELFEHSGTDPTSQGMSYQVLRKLFDTAAPDPRSLERYDKDGDQRFSLAELKAAAGLWEEVAEAAEHSIEQGEELCCVCMWSASQ